MAIRNPQRLLRFAADNYPLLKDLLDAGTVGWGELAQLIERHRRANDPELETIRENLLALGFLERQPDGDGLEMPQPLERFFRYIHREHHLTSAGQIQGYVEEIGRLERELTHSLEPGRQQQLTLLIDELAERIEQIRHDIGGNKEAITDAVIRFQANREESPLRDIYARVIWLWERYLVPIQDLIDTEQVMEQQLNSLEGTLLQAEQTLLVERPDLAGQLREVRLRLQRTRRQVVQDFREAMLELQPLYRRALRESQTAQAVSQILEHVRRHGVGSIALEQYIAAPVLRHEGQFSDLGTKAYLYGLIDYQPQADVQLDVAVESASEGRAQRLDLKAMLDELEAARPADAMAWLIQRLEAEGGGIRDLMMSYGRVVRTMDAVAQQERVEYRFGDYIVSARPHGLVKDESIND